MPWPHIVNLVATLDPKLLVTITRCLAFEVDDGDADAKSLPAMLALLAAVAPKERSGI